MEVTTQRKLDRQESIVDAAMDCFGRHGYRRTSMDEVAKEAGISRAALYLYFPNKEALFRALCEDVHDKLGIAAEGAAACEGTFEEKLTGIFDAKISVFFEVLAATEHGAELLDENNRLCGDVSARCKTRFHDVLVGLLVDAQTAGEISLDERKLSAERVADMIHSAVSGIEVYVGPTLTPERYRQELAQMLNVMVAGLVPR